MITLQNLAKSPALGNSFGFPNSNSAAVQEILFLDRGVTDYPLLAAGVRTGVEVVLVHSYADGVQQITEVLKQRQNIQTVHIVAHGFPGCLYLGNSQLNIKTLSYYADQLQCWFVSNLLLYGCHVGANPIFLQELKQLTGANIAATQKIIGNSELERNWDLEVTTGGINVLPVFEKQVMISYSSVLESVPVLIKDTEPVVEFSSLSRLTPVKDTLFFTVYDMANGKALWKTDGTLEGTVLVKDINEEDPNPVTDSSSISDLINFNDTLYFIADEGIGTKKLWKSDGTSKGTVIVKDLLTEHSPNKLTNINGTLYFQTYEIGFWKLWKSDGTPEGTIAIKDIGSAQLTNANGILYFSTNDRNHGYELWKSDGTPEGTVLVKDINSSPTYNEYTQDSNPNWLTNVNGTLYFSANDGIHGDELWKTDGTPEGTVLVKDIDSFPTYNKYTQDPNPNWLTNVNGTLYFSANDGIHGQELWKSDGTPEGTVLVKDINPGINSSRFTELINVNGTLYFSADDGIHGQELWKSDGTPEGTVLIADIFPGGFGGEPLWLTNVNNQVYFYSYGALWKSDGTEFGTVSVGSIAGGIYQPESLKTSKVESVVPFLDSVYFLGGDEGILGLQLWRLDIDPTPTTDLTISTDSVDENVATGTLVGDFSTINAEGGNFTYELVSGDDSTDNDSFSIDGNQLKINTSPNFEAKSSYNIRVKTTDAGGLSSEQALTINVNDVNEAPTATGEAVSTSKNMSITVELGDNLTDPDANGLANTTLNVTSTTNGTISNIDQNTRLITFAPTAGFSGTASFNYTVTDAGGLTSNEATVTVEVGDILTTGNKDQDLQGNSGNDYISSGNGKDRIQGFDGNDTLLGNNGADTLDGGAGDDLIDGGNGSDLLTGGAGRDQFILNANAGGDTITDFSLTDDWFKLGSGLTFGTGNNTDIKQSLSGSNLLISSADNTLLATLQNVNSFLTSSNFAI